MDTSSRLRIATRIHFALLRHYGEKVEIGALMKGEGDVHEALWVCEASGDPELAAMARQLKLASRAEAGRVRPAAAAAGPSPQDAAWSHNTSGFGVSRPMGLEAKPAATGGWLSPSTWMRRN